MADRGPVRGHMASGEWADGPHPERESYQSFADFTDPDGNIWLLQEVGHDRGATMEDEPTFAALAERHRRELHVHCYRMLASFDEAEDAVQETFLKAWRGRSGFDGGPQFRAWLYRIATNVCLDMLRRSSRRTAGGSFAEVPWLQPYPDQLLDAGRAGRRAARGGSHPAGDDLAGVPGRPAGPAAAAARGADRP